MRNPVITTKVKWKLQNFLAVLISVIAGISGDAMYGRNYWIACVWGFMTWKWGFQLFYFARDYKRTYETTYRITDDKVVPNFDTMPRDPSEVQA